MGCAAVYSMALLRVADYLQLDRQRAPAVLLNLKQPQSPLSIQEWEKHRVVDYIGPASDPRAVYITVSPAISLLTFLQINDLIADLQSELDNSEAVLSEQYGSRQDLKLDRLRLSRHRVLSNINTREFRLRLPYVPRRTGFSAHPHILSLLVEPLYGQHPGVGVRELVQNSTDAVRERIFWCSKHPNEANRCVFRQLGCDVLVEFISVSKEHWRVRVLDNGIGMTADTIDRYFLRAGASYRYSSIWEEAFVDSEGRPGVLRSGRFGIGAFALFLLGPTFRLCTRYIEDEYGYEFDASSNSQVIEIRKSHTIPTGTSVEIDLSTAAVELLGLNSITGDNADFISERINWYCWDEPDVKLFVAKGDNRFSLKQQFVVPVSKKERLPPQWYSIHSDDYDSVYWSFGRSPDLSVNGIVIADPDKKYEGINAWWPYKDGLRCPCVAVEDAHARLPLNIQRYKLASKSVSFADQLVRDVLLSYIAHALVRGPSTREQALGSPARHPLCAEPISEYEMWKPATEQMAHGWFRNGLLRWCTTRDGMVPADPTLFKLLNCNSYIVFGSLSFVEFINDTTSSLESVKTQKTLVETERAVMHWFSTAVFDTREPDYDERAVEEMAARYLAELIGQGITALGGAVESSSVFASVPNEIDAWAQMQDMVGTRRKGKGFHVNGISINSAPEKNEERHRIIGIRGTRGSSRLLQSVIRGIACTSQPSAADEIVDPVLYAGEFAIKFVELAESSTLARGGLTPWGQQLSRLTQLLATS